MCCDTVNRGLAYADGKIFLNQADTTIVALDAKTGKVLWSEKNGDPSKGETGTSAPVIVKDKVLVGISGAEFGVRGRLTAYDMKTGKREWIAYSTGPDSDMLVDPEKTTALGKPIGHDSSQILGRRPMENRRRHDLGLVLLRSQAEPHLLRVRQSLDLEPGATAGDNKYSLTIFARNPDTGMAKWVYQMTPHDQWDYDGINEMILADQNIGGKERKTLVHFDRNGFGYTLDRDTGELLVAEKYDPAVNWATKINMDKSSPSYGRPEVVAEYAPGSKGSDVNYTGICPAALGSKDQQPASYSPETELSTCRPITSAWITSPTASPIRPVSLMSAQPYRCTPLLVRPTWAISSLGTLPKVRSFGRIRSASRCGPVRFRRLAAWSSTARSKAI